MKVYLVRECFEYRYQHAETVCDGNSIDDAVHHAATIGYTVLQYDEKPWRVGLTKTAKGVEAYVTVGEHNPK